MFEVCRDHVYTEQHTPLSSDLPAHIESHSFSRTENTASCPVPLHSVSPHLMVALLGAHFSLHSFIGTFTQGHSHATSDPSFTISDAIFPQLFISPCSFYTFICYILYFGHDHPSFPPSLPPLPADPILSLTSPDPLSHLFCVWLIGILSMHIPLGKMFLPPSITTN